MLAIYSILNVGYYWTREASKEVGGPFDAFSSGSLESIALSGKCLQGPYSQRRLGNAVGFFLGNNL